MKNKSHLVGMFLLGISCYLTVCPSSANAGFGFPNPFKWLWGSKPPATNSTEPACDTEDDKISCLRNAAISYFLGENFTKAAETWGMVILEDQHTLDDRRNAAIAYFNAKNYRRSAELWSSVVKAGTEPNLIDSRSAAIAQFNAGDPEKSAEHWEEVLTIEHGAAPIEDLRGAAIAQFNAAIAKPDTADYTRSVELWELVIQNPAHTRSDIRGAAMANASAGNFVKSGDLWFALSSH